MKQKMTAVDVRALVLLLRKKLVGLRVANIYDVSGRLYLIKLSRANRKEHLLVESGIRIHTTNYVKNEKDLPSGFSMKLRKHLRTKKLEKIEQLGVDRVIDLTFGKGEAAYHILVELYASGNVILTDHEYTILSLLRIHKYEEEESAAVKSKYPFSQAANQTIDNITVDPAGIRALMEVKEPEPVQGTPAAPVKKGNKKEDKMTLKTILCKMMPYASFPYADHVLRLMNKEPNTKVDPSSDEQVTVLIEAATRLKELIRNMETMTDIKGYIVYTEDNKVVQESQSVVVAADIVKKFEGKIVQDFVPAFLLAQHEREKFLEFDSFDQCVDEYFSQAEKHKEKVKVESQENAIFNKMHKIKEDQEKRIVGLQREQDLSEFRAQLLQKFAFETQAIIDIISVMLSSGIGWNDITRMVKEERKAGNPLANLIYKINFEKNVVSLILDAVDESQHHQIEIDDHLISNFDPVMKIDVDLTVSAQLNIMRYFEIKKKSFQKEVKTKEAAQDAIKKAEVTAAKDFEKFKQSQVKANMNRKVFWFEKFIWFVTSENYLVIGGRNAQQNEALVKRYMDKHDLFMHSELHGASVCILKNPSGLPVPSLSLMEAATFEMCHSPCWEAKVLAQVYWVHAAQVSKTPPTGMFISTGSFIIRGKRNFITPQKLELGFTLMFCLHEDSLAAHIGERKPRGEVQEVEIKEDAEMMIDTTTQPTLDRSVSNISQQQMMIVSNEVGDDDDIKVVQVGEKPREYVPDKKNKQQQQQEDKKVIQKVKKEAKQEKGKSKDDDYSKQQNTGAVARGKHSKIKKMKEKYADQDSDERAARIALLGSKQVTGFSIEMHSKHKLGDLIQTEEERAIAEIAEESSEEEVQEEVPEVVAQAAEAEEEELIEEVKEGEVEPDDFDDEAEIMKLIKEEDINAVPENTDVSEIDKLTGIPKPKDQLLFCIPMLAPYSTIHTFKYKAKVQPGTLKRGRAQKQIRSLFISQAGKTAPVELQYMKVVSEQDMTMTLINSCRVLAPGLQKVQTQNKQDKRKKAKE